MSDNTGIEWTDTTWNPALGCDRVSDGCDHCYAIGQAHIRAANPNPRVATAFAGLTERTERGTDWTGRINLLPERLDQPLHWKKPRRIFVNSMSDLFHKDIPDGYVAAVFAIMAAAPQHTFQLLTKRHGRLRSLLTDSSRFQDLMAGATRKMYFEMDLPIPGDVSWSWPLPNVWLGVSAEDQQRADLRIPALLDTPAAVRWVSAEPLLGPIDLARWLVPEMTACQTDGQPETMRALAELGRAVARRHGWAGLDWVVTGGESGPGARPMHPGWARNLRDQCTTARVPFLFKQWGAWTPTGKVGLGGTLPGEIRVGEPVDEHGFRVEMRRTSKKAAGRKLDGREWNEYPTVTTAACRDYQQKHGMS